MTEQSVSIEWQIVENSRPGKQMAVKPRVTIHIKNKTAAINPAAVALLGEDFGEHVVVLVDPTNGMIGIRSPIESDPPYVYRKLSLPGAKNYKGRVVTLSAAMKRLTINTQEKSFSTVPRFEDGVLIIELPRHYMRPTGLVSAAA